jgi:CPA1 family monovalent cation:H+ antiporter
MDAFTLAAIFAIAVAAVSWLNARILKLPSAVAMLIAGAVAALLLVAAVRSALPTTIADQLLASLREVDFPSALLQWLLGFLLFSGALQVDMSALARRWPQIVSIATAGVIASVLIVSFALWSMAGLVSWSLPLAWAFVFAALISPTDPVAVLAIAGGADRVKDLRTILQGEALFNDGVGIVVFSGALAFATTGQQEGWVGLIMRTAGEGIGAVALGAAGGWLVIRLSKSIDEYVSEVMMTIALVMGVYAGAQALHVSGPIAAAVAGVMIAQPRARAAMSETTRKYVVAFWRLVGEILNAGLFLLLGLELAVADLQLASLALAALAIVCVLLARALIVIPFAFWLRPTHSEKGSALILFTGGMRGAVSVALCLALPDGESRTILLTMTFAVVIFSILIQGLAFEPVVKRLSGHIQREA